MKNFIRFRTFLYALLFSGYRKQAIKRSQQVEMSVLFCALLMTSGNLR